MKSLITKKKFIRNNISNKILNNNYLVFFKKDKNLNLDILLSINFYFKLRFYFLINKFRNKFSIYGNFYFVFLSTQTQCINYLNLLKTNNINFFGLKLDSQFFRSNFIFENIGFVNFFLFCMRSFVLLFFLLIKTFFMSFLTFIYNLNAYHISIVKKSS